MANPLDEHRSQIRRVLEGAGRLICPLGDIVDLKLIGEGGNGIVFSGILARRKVAIKVLVEHGSAKLDRFRSEYLALAFLPPHVGILKPIAFHEVTIERTQLFFIVMPLYGGALRRGQEGAPTLAETRALLLSLIDAIGFCHRHGIVHRDLKPQNLLVEGDRVVVTDFGIASYAEEFLIREQDTKSGEILGNREFSAPEQLTSGLAASPTMDIFAIGQICQWFVTGAAHRGTFRAKLADAIPDLAYLDGVIDQCLANNPEKRFQSCEDLAAAIAIAEGAKHALPRSDPWDQLHLLHDAIAQTFPKNSGLTVSLRPEDSARFLRNLATRDFKKELWWTRGHSSNYLSRIEPIDAHRWLLDRLEVTLDKIAVYTDPSRFNCFAILQFAPSSPFGIYSTFSSGEEAGIVDGEHYITFTENDNGYALINGETVSLSDHQVESRVRYMKTHTLVITVRNACAFQFANDDTVDQLVSRLDNISDIPDDEVRQFASTVRKHKAREIADTL